MSDFDYLKYLVKEYTDALELRREAQQKGIRYIENRYCKSKLRRLRLEIQNCMLEIERKCDSVCYIDKEEWM